MRRKSSIGRGDGAPGSQEDTWQGKRCRVKCGFRYRMEARVDTMKTRNIIITQPIEKEEKGT